jgi:hypothetical protein
MLQRAEQARVQLESFPQQIPNQWRQCALINSIVLAAFSTVGATAAISTIGAVYAFRKF